MAIHNYLPNLKLPGRESTQRESVHSFQSSPPPPPFRKAPDWRKGDICAFRKLIIQYSLGFDTRRFPERPRLDPSHPYCLGSRGATCLRRSGFRLDREPEPPAPQSCFPSPFAILGCAAVILL